MSTERVDCAYIQFKLYSCQSVCNWFLNTIKVVVTTLK